MTEAVLKLSDLQKTFTRDGHEVRAVDGVDLTIPSGEFVALHGPSGCGKSTLLLMTGGLMRPGAGTVEIQGENPYTLSANQRGTLRAKHIGFMFQQFYLIPYLSVMENVMSPSLALSHPDAAGRAEELLERFQLTARREHVPSALSVGEQQRVALARALMHQPPLLLADEPTGNLDPENADRVLNALAELAEQGKTVIMVTHDPRARDRATRQVELAAGKIVEDTASARTQSE